MLRVLRDTKCSPKDTKFLEMKNVQHAIPTIVSPRDGQKGIKKTTTPPTPISPAFATERKVNHACTACRKHHKACTGGRPCERCIRNGTEDQCQSAPRKKRVVTKRSWSNFLDEAQSKSTNSPPNVSTSPELLGSTLEVYKMPHLPSPSETTLYQERQIIIPSLVLPPIRNDFVYGKSSSTFLGCLESPPRERSDSLDDVREITRQMEDLCGPSVLLPDFRPQDLSLCTHKFVGYHQQRLF